MKRNWLAVLGGSLMAGVLVASALASPGWGRGWGGGAGWSPRCGPCWRQVGTSELSPEQLQRLEELRKQHFQEMASLRQQAWAERKELWTLRSQLNPDLEAISKLERELFDLHSLMRERSFAFRQQMRKIDPNLWCGLGFGGPWGMGRGPWGPPGTMMQEPLPSLKKGD